MGVREGAERDRVWIAGSVYWRRQRQCYRFRLLPTWLESVLSSLRTYVY